MQDKIYFPDSKERKICGVLSNPAPEPNVPVIILVHGFTTSKDSITYQRLEKVFNEKNIATLRIDLFGHGESEGDFEDITISKAVDDILNSIKYLKEKGFSKIGLIGSSFGGMSSIMAASRTNDLFLLVLRSPVSDYFEVDTKRRTKEEMEEWKNKGYVIHVNSFGEKRRLNYSFFEDFKNNNAYEAAKKIKIPTLIVHGDNDNSVPVEQSKKTASIIENCKLEIIEGADHKYSKPEDFEKMLNLIEEFVVGELGV